MKVKKKNSSKDAKGIEKDVLTEIEINPLTGNEEKKRKKKKGKKTGRSKKIPKYKILGLKNEV